MKRRQRPDDPTVSLFPFLTVLICTIGMLIVLLVISVRAVGSKSQQIAALAAEEQRGELARIQGELDLHELRGDGWREIRGKRVEQIRRAQEERSYLEAALQELDDEARSIAAQLQQLTSGGGSQEELEAAETRLLELRARVETERESQPPAPSTDSAAVLYNLVPYTGPGGTNRRPIYVECSNQKLVLQPWGVELQLADFAVPGEPGNPLDAGLTTIREYWRKYDLAGDRGTPYPLLVVRPSGAQAYAVARRAMTSWVDEFGYELIPEDKPLKYGDSDPQLAAEIRQAVDSARRAQALLAEQLQYRERVLQQRAIARQMATGGGSGLRADRARGGFSSDSRFASTHAQDGSGAAALQKLLGNDPNAPPSISSDDATGASRIEDAARPTAASGSRSEALAASTQFPGNSTQPPAPSETFPRGNPDARPAPTASPTTPSGSANQGSERTGSAKSASSNAQGEGGSSSLSSGNCPAPLAASRGSDWALPGRNSPRATAYLRPIKVICSANELLIETGPNSPLNSNAIDFPTETAAAIEPLVGSLWRLIDSWGPTPDNGYWKPVLKVETRPGGETRARDLMALLQGSGIELFEENRE